ncbi:MAG: YHS domain-containing (seleno)protein [Pseudomonadota bacterium]
MKRQSLLAAMVLLITGWVQAADPNIFSTKKGAIRGFDPVAYFNLTDGDKAVRGSDEITYEWMGATWKFANTENRDAFAANPEKFAPQYGGYCAFAVSHGFTKPVDEDAWRIVDGKLYLNLSKRVKKKWEKDVPGNIAKGDANWPTALTSCEEHGNCRKI